MKRVIRQLLGSKSATFFRFYHWVRVQLGRPLWEVKYSFQVKRKSLRILGEKPFHYFFGYYDLCPFDAKEERLLACRTNTSNTPLSEPKDLDVGFFELSNSVQAFRVVGKTRAWCWQQGARLQWIIRNGSEHLFYNSFDNTNKSVIQNVETGEIVNTFSKPLYSLDNEGRHGLTLNFSRLHRLRPGYGYVGLKDETQNEAAPKDDGIWLMDLNTQKETFLFSIKEISLFEPLESMNGAEHYFNHILFNPSGNRFLFLHLWVKDGKRYSRLVTCNRDGSSKFALINEGYISHYFWKNDEELIAFAFHKEGGKTYYKYKDQTNERRVVDQLWLNKDGHPSYSKNGMHLLTDTYPNYWRFQRVFLYSFENKVTQSLGFFYTPESFKGEVRVDLHPRFSPSERYVCLDLVHKQKRAIGLIELDN